MLDYENARSLMDVIRDYYVEHRSQRSPTLKQLYYADSYPGIKSWSVAQYDGSIPARREIRWEARGSSQAGDVIINRYLLHHSRYLEMPLLHIHKAGKERRPLLMWLGESGGKATAQDWPSVVKYLDAGYDIVSIDPRGLGETRMPYKAASPDDPELGKLDFDHAYLSPLSGVLADYVYNSLLTGRPYFLQMIEDVEIASRFAREEIKSNGEFKVTAMGEAYTLASAVTETLPNIKLLSQPESRIEKWSDLVNQERELWPIQYLLPDGAYVH
jgi:hypothetical protein